MKMRDKKELENLKFLGEKLNKSYFEYDPKLLETINNLNQKNEYLINIIAHEFLSLNKKTKKPFFGSVYFSYVPNEKLVESKSLKLYIGSFRNSYTDPELLASTIKNDLEKILKPKYLRITFEDFTSQKKYCLECTEKETTFQLKENTDDLNDFKKDLIEINDFYFSTLCPKTSQPDFAKIFIKYIPNKKLFDENYFKDYLKTFLQNGNFHEDCVNLIKDELVKNLTPQYLEVLGIFAIRGGIAIFPFSNYSCQKFQAFKRMRLLEIIEEANQKSYYKNFRLI